MHNRQYTGNFSGATPNGEVVVSRINQRPYLPPNPSRQLTSGGYWVVHNYGQNNAPASLVLTPGKGVYAPDPPAIFMLSKRDSSSEVSDWVAADPQGDAVAGNALTFNTNLSFQFGKQYAITDGKGVKLDLKVFLQGTYNAANGNMNDHLRAAGLLPNNEPFTALAFVHKNGGGAETVLPSVWTVGDANAIVDWMFVEVRDKNNPATVLYTRSALVQKDGDVVDTDGISTLYMNQVPPDQYYIALRHRNHFGFRTAGTYTLSATPTTLNLTNNTVPLYGNNPLNNIGGVYVMYSADANRDGVVNAIDRNAHWRLQNGGAYNYLTSTADFNLDGTVNAIDRNAHWRVNNSLVQQLD